MGKAGDIKRTMVFEKGKKWKWEEDGFTVVRSLARTGPGCHEGCGVLLYVKDGRLVKVEGDSEFPFNQGRLCLRCLSLPQLVYHPDRLTHPLKRAGERGDGRWERITWEEAFDTIVKKFDEIRKHHGPESVLFCQGTGRDIAIWQSKLAFSFQSPNRVGWGPLFGSACYYPKVVTQGLVMGNLAVADCSQFFPDRYDNPAWKVPECIVIWGNEPIACSSDGFSGPWIVECIKRGSKLVVVDPRRTWLATRAEAWLQIRPGTDAALALGMLNVIISEGLYDREFVEKWTHGFEELKRRAMEYPPKRVSEITWLPEELIVKAARLYATSKPAAIQWGVAIDQSKECVPTIHAIIALWAITGNMDVPGGNVIKDWHLGLDLLKSWGAETLSEEQKQKRIGLESSPLSPPAGQHVIDQMLSGVPYPIKASWIQTTNTFVTEADPKRVYEAFRGLEFNVVVDLFMTPTAMAFADIVLPAATYPEKDGVGVTAGNVWTNIRSINKAIEPIGECKSDQEINFEVGRRLTPEFFPWDDVHGMFSAAIAPLGISWEELREMNWVYEPLEYRKYGKGLLRKDGKPGFNTPTGKVELYSTELERVGLDPLPYYEEPPESPVNTPELAREYPLVLTTGARYIGFFHSEHRQIPALRQFNPDPKVEMHPETARKCGIRDGDWVYIENRHGRCRQRAKLTADIHPRVVNAQHGWWFPEKAGKEPGLFGAWESNVNLLLPSGWTGKSGLGYPFKNMLCRVYRAEGC